MTVASSASSIQTKNKTPRIVFIGQPNTGKSTFFNTVTKSNAGVANWPGLTVDFMQANLDYNGKTYEFVDLPGIYDLEGFTEDELVVQKFLESYNFDLIVCVINSSQIDRQILMPLQVQKLGLPCILMLNMADEVKRFGVKINTKELSETLNMPVFTISAKYGSGCVLAIQGIWDKLQTIDDSYKCSDIASFFRANKVTDKDMDEVTRIGVEMPSEDVTTFSNRLDSILLNRVVGLPIFFISMLLVFLAIWFVGMPLQDPVGNFTDWLQATVIEPSLSFLPEGFSAFIVNGPYAGFAALLGFVPLVAFFFVVMTALEDSGYLSRAAYLMDALMRSAGLDGRGFVLQLFGFGCNVPAIMGTRTIRSKSQRLLSILIIPFALCSARLQVFVLSLIHI